MSQLIGRKRALPFASMGLIRPNIENLDETVSSVGVCDCKRFCPVNDRYQGQVHHPAPCQAQQPAAPPGLLEENENDQEQSIPDIFSTFPEV